MRISILSIVLFTSICLANGVTLESFNTGKWPFSLRLSQSAQLRAELQSIGRSASKEMEISELFDDYSNYESDESVGVAPDVDLESRLTHCELVNRRGFSCEEHFATTADGFILGLFRVGQLRTRDEDARQKERAEERMNNAERPVVLLMHGLFDCSFTWINNFREQSLAYVLVDAGFDVWLGNVRGNYYSRNHTTLKPSEKAFWWWTLDEMARHDLNATTLYILQRTGQPQLSYVGHSQGSAIMFAALASYKDIADRVKFFAALAPAARVGNVKGTLRLLTPDDWLVVLKALEVATTGEILAVSDEETDFERRTCGKDDEMATVCLRVLQSLLGFGDMCNRTRIPVYSSKSTAGSSVLNAIHWMQEVRSGEFQQMDWGEALNQAKYGQIAPPLYDPRRISVPVALLSSTRDWFSDAEDVGWLAGALDRSLVFHGHYNQYSHLGFVWSPNAFSDIYRDVVRLLNAYSRH